MLYYITLALASSPKFRTGRSQVMLTFPEELHLRTTSLEFRCEHVPKIMNGPDGFKVNCDAPWVEELMRAIATSTNENAAKTIIMN